MFQRVRIAGRVLPGNLPKIHSQDLPSFLYASKRCSSRSDHRLCLLVLERPCSVKHPSSSLRDSGSLSLNPPSSSLLDAPSFAMQEPRHQRLCPPGVEHASHRGYGPPPQSTESLHRIRARVMYAG
jgi:hypothetical protein